jgi:hypothetical protein
MTLHIRTPQTAFLQRACLLALENIVARLDREQAYRPYFRVVFEPPAHAEHDSWDFCDMAGRYVDALILIRQLTGRSAPHEESALRQFLLKMAHPEDGLFYNQTDPCSPYVADMFCQSRVLIALATWFMETSDEAVMKRLRGLVQGLIRIAERRDDYVFYPRNLYREGEWLEGGLFYEPKNLWTAHPGYGGTQLEGIIKYYELSGDEEALEFAGRYLRFFFDVAKVVDEEGRFEGHLHSQGIVPTMVGAAMYAEITQDDMMLTRCDRFLRFTLDHCSRFGWVPDGIGKPTCETCAIADVIHLATRLSRLGLCDYWYDIERFARNQLLENQFVDAERVLQGRNPEPGLASLVRGSFASWAKPNDLLGGPDIEGCCTAGGVRAAFHVLSNAIGRDSEDALVVRMLLSVDTAEVHVHSSLPYKGVVEIQPKTAARLKIRLPEWTRPLDVSLRVNGRKIPVQVVGRYVVMERVSAGSTIEMLFPVPIETHTETVAGESYLVTWKGNTVVDVAPEGRGYPTYRRRVFCGRTTPRGSWDYPVQGSRVYW